MPRLMTAAIVGAVAIATTSASAQTPPLIALEYNGKPVNGYRGHHSDFPAAFVGTPLCENGRSASDAKSSCILLNPDGTGTWENDRGPGRIEPAAPIEWYVVADQKGTVTKVGTTDRDTYFVILKFTQSYYGAPAGMLRAFPANIVRGTSPRAVIDSKYRNF